MGAPGAKGQRLSNMSINIDQVTEDCAHRFIDEYSECLINAIHDAVNISKNKCMSKKHKKSHHWWTTNCTVAKSRKLFWHNIWKSCGRPFAGAIYESYKLAKKQFRINCRSAYNQGMKVSYNLCSKLYNNKCMNKFWNIISRNRKKSNSSYDNISIETLENHFESKFSYDVDNENVCVKEARMHVNKLLRDSKTTFECVVTEYEMKMFIKKLNSGSAPGIDGVTAGHVKSAINSSLVSHLCSLLSLCFKFSIVPNSVTKGILVPLLKKPSLDQSNPNNYRPVVLSTTFSKLIELYILYKCDKFSFNKLQFGFIKGRGTDSAVALAHDISSYFVNNGSQVYMCNLDAKGAFDALPFPVIFSKLYHVLPEMCWKILYNWYHKIKVQIKWNKMGKPIKMCKGTKQGGLSSPFIFNIFYKELLDILEIQEGGISIGNRKYNVICYADDLLLLSSTVTGLQGLINKANTYIVNHGLRFNPNKTKCIINGKNPFIKDPKWYINESELEVVEHINFLGRVLGNNCSKYHSASRISSCRKSFYALQHVGLCEKGLSIDAAMYIWTSICKTSLLYGCNALYLKKTDLNDIEKLQAKLVKCILGLKPFYKSTKLLQALKLNKCINLIECDNISLLNRIMNSNSAAREFYLYVLKKNVTCKTLLYITE